MARKVLTPRPRSEHEDQSRQQKVLRGAAAPFPGLDFTQPLSQIPSLLFATLSCAFWLSFSRIGLPAVAPTTWPLIWLGMAVCVMIVPLPVLSRPSRFWLHRSMARLLLPGLRSVEVIPPTMMQCVRTDNIPRVSSLGISGWGMYPLTLPSSIHIDDLDSDQLCSFVFSLSNLYIVGCAYACGFDHRWQRCSATSRDWVVPFVLASLPFLIRTVQSLRRYHDSKLVNHLINVSLLPDLMSNDIEPVLCRIGR
jgi:hypothetical protein